MLQLELYKKKKNQRQRQTKECSKRASRKAINWVLTIKLFTINY